MAHNHSHGHSGHGAAGGAAGHSHGAAGHAHSGHAHDHGSAGGEAHGSGHSHGAAGGAAGHSYSGHDSAGHAHSGHSHAHNHSSAHGSEAAAKNIVTAGGEVHGSGHSHAHDHSAAGHSNSGHSHAHSGHGSAGGEVHGSGHSNSGHSHAHNHSSAHGSEAAARNIVTAFALNLGFAVVELIGGLVTNSVAILSDAVHDFGDSVSLGVAWVLQRRAGRGRDARFSYGYRRFSLLGSVFLSGVLLVSSIFIVSEAVQRLMAPAEVHARGMLWLAVAGIVINGAAILRLRKGTSLNERAVWLHLLEDVLGWVAVLVASAVMLIVDAPWTRLLDPLLSLGITVWVLRGVWRNLRDTFRILLQGVPADFDQTRLSADILAVPGVASLHDLHVWSQDGETHVMTVHVVLVPTRPTSTSDASGASDASDVSDASGASHAPQLADTQVVKHAVREIGRAYGADHVTVEIELPGEAYCEYLAKCK